MLTLVAAERSTVLSPKSTRSPPRTPALTLFSTLSCFPLACSDALSAFSIRASVADSSGSAEVTVTVRRPEWAWVRVKKSARTEGVRGSRAFWERTERRLVVICETAGRRRFPVQRKRARESLMQGWVGRLEKMVLRGWMSRARGWKVGGRDRSAEVGCQRETSAPLRWFKTTATALRTSEALGSLETTALMPASRSEAVRVGLPDLRYRGGSFRRRAERTQRREGSKQVKGAKQAGQISLQPSRSSDSPFALDPFQAASESKCGGDGRRRSQREGNGPKKTTLLSLAAMSLLMA